MRRLVLALIVLIIWGMGCGQGSSVVPEGASPMSLVNYYPLRGTEAGGTPVFLYGKGLMNIQAVRFGDKEATGLKVISDNAAMLTTPPGKPGFVDVLLVAKSGADLAIRKGFEYLAADSIPVSARHVTAARMRPPQGPASGGTIAIIEGEGFGRGMKVYFCGKEA